jgi:phosphatidylinositol kinase/protein kinase (PI-3  family)
LFLFGESQVEQENRIKSISPFGNLPKYRLAHFMVKTYDDLRQEAFAMQLLE